MYSLVVPLLLTPIAKSVSYPINPPLFFLPHLALPNHSLIFIGPHFCPPLLFCNIFASYIIPLLFSFFYLIIQSLLASLLSLLTLLLGHLIKCTYPKLLHALNIYLLPAFTFKLAVDFTPPSVWLTYLSSLQKTALPLLVPGNRSHSIKVTGESNSLSGTGTTK